MADTPASQEEKQERILQVAALLSIYGLSPNEAYHHIRDKFEWGKTLSYRMAYYYVEWAREQLAKEAMGISIPEQIGMSVARHTHAYKVAMALKDIARATAAQRSIDALLHLDQPRTVMSWEQSYTVENPNKLRAAVTMLAIVAQQQPEKFDGLFEIIQNASQEAQGAQVTYELPANVSD